MKRVFCDIPTCKKEFNSHSRSTLLDRYPFVIKIETYARLANGQPGPPLDVCWDCIIQALIECNPLDDTPPVPPGPPPPQPPITKP